MAADDDTQDAVRRVLNERPPEELPPGADARLRQRLDKEPSPVRSPARASRATVPRKKKTPARKKAARPRSPRR